MSLGFRDLGFRVRGWVCSVYSVREQTIPPKKTHSIGHVGLEYGV